MVRTEFVGYGGWLARFGLSLFLFFFFFLQFVDLSGHWSVGVVVGGFLLIW